MAKRKYFFPIVFLLLLVAMFFPCAMERLPASGQMSLRLYCTLIRIIRGNN